MLTQLRADARKQHCEAERLGDVVVGAGFETEDRVGIGVVPREHDDRRLESVLAHDANGFAPVHVGKPDIHHDEIDLPRFGFLHAFGGGIDRDRVELFMQGELLDQSFAQLGVVIDNQNFTGVRHSFWPQRTDICT